MGKRDKKLFILYEDVRVKPRVKLKATKVERSKKNNYSRKLKHKNQEEV